MCVWVCLCVFALCREDEGVISCLDTIEIPEKDILNKIQALDIEWELNVNNTIQLDISYTYLPNPFPKEIHPLETIQR